jgi:hypothetical protein
MPVGPGGINANGVYLYGESDAATPVSDMLNLGMGSVSTQFTNDRARLSSLETTAANPNVYVAPSAAARDAKYGDPAAMNATQRKALQDLGVLIYRTDLGIIERFYAIYNASTNVNGALAYGYYPLNGQTGAQATRNNTSGASLTNNAYTNVSFNLWGRQNLTLNNVVPSNFVIVAPGYYSVQGWAPTASFSSTAGTQRNMNINVNNTNGNLGVIAADVTTNLSSGYLQPTTVARFGVGDVVRAFLFQDSGSAQTHNATYLSIDYLRPANV